MLRIYKYGLLAIVGHNKLASAHELIAKITYLNGNEVIQCSNGPKVNGDMGPFMMTFYCDLGSLATFSKCVRFSAIFCFRIIGRSKTKQKCYWCDLRLRRLNWLHFFKFNLFNWFVQIDWYWRPGLLFASSAIAHEVSPETSCSYDICVCIKDLSFLFSDRCHHLNYDMKIFLLCWHISRQISTNSAFLLL